MYYSNNVLGMVEPSSVLSSRCVCIVSICDIVSYLVTLNLSTRGPIPGAPISIDICRCDVGLLGPGFDLGRRVTYVGSVYLVGVTDFAAK